MNGPPVDCPPDVSVVVPTINRPKSLARTVSTILAQQSAQIEVVVVHDGPDRGGLARVADCGDPRVRVLELIPRRGMAAARNQGVRVSTGEWLAFCDDDDLWSPTKLRDQLEAVRAAHARFAFSSVVAIDELNRIVGVFPAPDPAGLEDALLARLVIPAGSSSVMVRRAELLEVGAWDENLVHFSDWDMWIRLAASLKAVAVPAVGVAYAQHPAGNSMALAAELFDDFHRLMAKHASLITQRGIRPDVSAFTRFVAERQRRAGRSRAAARLYMSVARQSHSLRDLALAAYAFTGLPVPKRRRPAAQDWIRNSAPYPADG